MFYSPHNSLVSHFEMSLFFPLNTHELHNVYGLLIKDPLAGLGVDTNHAKKLYSHDDPVPLVDRTKALRMTLTTKASAA